ncbi:MAG: pseudouridylate synthase [Rikenellaceae bacterium]|nr:pseudouridylate synthase [Rikenellaceae bacterium]
MDSINITEEYLRSIDVHTVLPQQEPFVMIDTLTHFEMTTSTTETVIRPENIFVDNGCFSGAGMMENIAQTCAARIGFYNKYILKKEVQVGFIGAIRNYVVGELPPVGATITTKVDILEEIFGMTLANAVVECNGKVAATAEIKLSVRSVE